MASFNFLNARIVIRIIVQLALAKSAIFASARDDDNFRPKSVPYSINHREALYREFTLVTEGPFNPSQAVKPSITQSVLTGGNNVTERFFTGLEEIDHYETPFTTVTIIAEDVGKVAGVLNKISSFYESYSTTEAISYYPLYTFIIMIPIDTTVTRDRIKQLILAKTKPNSLEHLLLDSNIFLAFTKTNLLFDKGKEQTQSDIWEVYSIKNRTFLRNVKEQWEAVDGRLFRKSKLLRRQDWEGVEVICSTFNTAVDEQGEIQGISRFELNVQREPDGKFALKSGFSANILSDFEEALNFTRELLHPYADYTDLTHFFDKYDNAFDLVVSHHGLNPERLKQIHHLAPSYFDGIWAYFVQPPVHTFRNIYVAPFAPSMWGMMALTWLVILFSFKLISWVRSSFILQPGPYWEKEELEERERDEVVNQESFWWAVAAACQQGWYVTPASTPVRGVFFTGLLFSLLCYAAYTATIVSELWDYVVPIRSLQGLLENSQDVYLGEDSDIATMIFQGMGQGIQGQKLMGKLRLTDVPTAFEKMVGQKRGRSCLLQWPEYVVEAAREKFTGSIAGRGEEENSDSDASEKNAEVNFCEQVRSFRYEYLPSKASMFVPKKSPFRETLNYRILVGVERGLFRRYWEEYRKNTRIRCLEESKKSYALGIYDTWIVFGVLLAGYGGSLGVLVVEIAYKRMKVARAVRKLK